MMKKTLLFLMSAFAATAMSATDYVLDLSKPAYPEVINFTANGNAQVWSDTYNENEYILEFSPYMFSHLASGSSWNGTYWDGFTIVKCGDNATQTNWIANQWGNMAGGGINANGKADASVPYMFAYCPDFMPNICTMMYDDEKTYYVKGMYVKTSPLTAIMLARTAHRQPTHSPKRAIHSSSPYRARTMPTLRNHALSSWQASTTANSLRSPIGLGST